MYDQIVHKRQPLELIITVIKGCQPVTHLHSESSEQGS